MPKKRRLFEFKGFDASRSARTSVTPELPVPPLLAMPFFSDDEGYVYDDDDVARLEARKEYTARHPTHRPHHHRRRRHPTHHHHHHHRHRHRHHPRRHDDDRRDDRHFSDDDDDPSEPPDRHPRHRHRHRRRRDEHDSPHGYELRRHSRPRRRAPDPRFPSAEPRLPSEAVPRDEHPYRRTDYDNEPAPAPPAYPYKRTEYPSSGAPRSSRARDGARAMPDHDAPYPSGTHHSPDRARALPSEPSTARDADYDAPRMYMPSSSIPLAMAPGDGVEINVPPGPPHYQGIAPPLPPGHHLPPVPDPRDPRDTLGDRVPDDRILADEYQDRVRRDRYERNGYYRRKRHRHYRRHHGGHRRRRRRRKRHHEEHGEQGQHRPHGEEGSGDDESSSKKSHKSKKKSSDSDSDSKSDSSSSGGRIFTKKKVAKAGLATLLAVGVGLAAKKLLSSKKKKKEQAKLESGGGTEGDSDNEGGAEDESLPGYYADPVYRPPPIPATSLFNVRVPPNQVCIVERGGRYHRKLNSGSNFVNPVSDKIAYCHSMKELAVPVPWQECFSSDNVPFRANAMLYMRVEDPVAASYSVDNPYHSIVLLAQTLIRNQMARYTKERGFQDRIRIGDRILDEINDTCRAWGVRCLKFELRDLEVPMEIQERLEEEEEEERQHRMAELQAEADRIEAVNRAEAEFQAQVKASQARQLEIVNQAIGEAHAIEERGEAVANALRGVAQVVNEPGGQEAMQMRLAERFIDAYSRATSAPTVAPPNPSNVASNMNNAIGLLNTLGDNDPSVQIPNIPMRASANPFVEKPKVPSRPKPTARPGHKKPVGYPGSPQQSEIPAPVKVVGPITATAKVHESDLSSESDRRSHVESDDPKSKIQNAKLKPRIASSHARPGRAAPRRGSNPESLSDSRESRRRPASSTPPRSDQKAKPKPHAHKDTLKKIQAGLEDKFGSIQDTVEGLIDRF